VSNLLPSIFLRAKPSLWVRFRFPTPFTAMAGVLMTPQTLDNTNAEPETRAIWIKLARRMKVPVRCVYLASPPKLCEHNDTVRALGGALMNPEQRTILPRVAFASYAFRFREPVLKEGFHEIIKVEFKVSVILHCMSVGKATSTALMTYFGNMYR